MRLTRNLKIVVATGITYDVTPACTSDDQLAIVIRDVAFEASFRHVTRCGQQHSVNGTVGRIIWIDIHIGTGIKCAIVPEAVNVRVGWIEDDGGFGTSSIYELTKHIAFTLKPSWQLATCCVECPRLSNVVAHDLPRGMGYFYVTGVRRTVQSYIACRATRSVNKVEREQPSRIRLADDLKSVAGTRRRVARTRGR